ncbi:unnamed protein product, partial [Adineta steineri]
LSYNQPKFCPTAMWNTKGITLANQSIVGWYPFAIFINTNNTIYVANKENRTIVVWDEQSVNPTKNIYGDFTEPLSLFVTPNGDIYIDDGREKGRVLKWIVETNKFATVMNVHSSCFGLFVDIDNTLYCSIFAQQQVVKRSFNDPLMTSNRVAAGTGIKGYGLNELNGPVGIFVDINLDLYVTDCDNDRVQLFQSGESNGITVAGSGSRNPTITLDCPSGIILDAEKYLFIVDLLNNRIVGSSSNGFQCLVGCYGRGSQSNQLTLPFSLSFDRSGNIYVADNDNFRIQKFQYIEESCHNLVVIETMYSSSLISNSSTYFKDCSELDSYYEAIQMNINITGYYAFLISSKMKSMYAYIYTNNFNPFDVSENVLSHNKDYENQGQFKVTAILQANMIYVVVMTTSSQNLTGNFSIQVFGPSYVGFNRIREYL